MRGTRLDILDGFLFPTGLLMLRIRLVGLDTV